MQSKKVSLFNLRDVLTKIALTGIQKGLGSACVSEAAALTMSNYVLHRHSCGFDKMDYEEKLEDLVLLFT